MSSVLFRVLFFTALHPQCSVGARVADLRGKRDARNVRRTASDAANLVQNDLTLRAWVDHVKNLPVHMLQVPQESPAADGEYKFEQRWFDQRLDHFNKQHPGSFRQRYFVYDHFSRLENNYPIFVFCGAEQGDIYRLWDHYGFVLEVARKEGAKVLFLEHRFFGQSKPHNTSAFDVEADRIGLLSTDQALADYADIIRLHRGEGPVLTFGGSLSGTLAILMRIHYSSLVDMAFASSAPIIGLPSVSDQYAWRRRLTANFAELGGSDCPDFVRQGFAAFAQANHGDLRRAYNPCEEDVTDDQWSVLSRKIWAFLDMLGTFIYPASMSGIGPVCSMMRDVHGKHSGTGAFAPLMSMILGQASKGDCLNMTELYTPGNKSAEKSGAPEDLGWSYLACTEIIHPIGANNETDMFPPHDWTVERLASSCRRAWNVTPDAGYLERKLDLRVEGSGSQARMLKSTDVPGKVLMSYGEFDPWSTMIPREGWADDVEVVRVPGGSHCSDLETPRDYYDTDGMRQARFQEADIIRRWINDVRPIRSMKLNPFHEGTNASKAGGLKGVAENIGGGVSTLFHSALRGLTRNSTA